jgi:predicted HTH transcriptional regulator
MTLSLLDIETLREGWDFEAKKAAGRDGRGKLPEDFWPTYSAMANTRGGKVALGVRERPGRTLEVHGIVDPEKVVRELWDLLHNRNKTSENLLGEDDVTIEEVAGRRIILVNIPRARREQRPVFVGGDVWNGTFIRVHDGDRRLERERVRRMLAESDRGRPVDSRVLTGLGMEAIDLDTLRQYRSALASRKADHPFLREGDRDFLERLGAWGRDSEVDREGPRVAGLLAFGREHAIRDAFPHFMLDYQRHPSETALGRRWDDRVAPDGTWNANLLQFYWRVFPRVVEGLQIPFELSEGSVRRAETRVHEALREAMVNSLIHADWESRLGITIVRRVGGFFLRNPGTLLLPEELVRAGGTSECRNPGLQHIFNLIGLGERAGSGFPAIIQAWRSQHWRAPALEEDPELGCTSVMLSMASLMPPEVMAELERRFGSRFSLADEVARLAIATAAIEGRVTNRRIQELAGRHPRDITLMLGALVEAGLLDPHGDRRGAWYTVRGWLTDQGDSSQGEASSSQTEANSSQTEANSSQTETSSSQTETSSSQTKFGSQGPDNSYPIDIIEQVASGRWASRALVEQAILACCQMGYMTVRQIAERLARKPSTIQKNYIIPLVKQGRLSLRYPGRPNHPEQAYKATEVE